MICSSTAGTTLSPQPQTPINSSHEALAHLHRRRSAPDASSPPCKLWLNKINLHF